MHNNQPEMFNNTRHFVQFTMIDEFLYLFLYKKESTNMLQWHYDTIWYPMQTNAPCRSKQCIQTNLNEKYLDWQNGTKIWYANIWLLYKQNLFALENVLKMLRQQFISIQNKNRWKRLKSLHWYRSHSLENVTNCLLQVSNNKRHKWRSTVTHSCTWWVLPLKQ